MYNSAQNGDMNFGASINMEASAKLRFHLEQAFNLSKSIQVMQGGGGASAAQEKRNQELEKDNARLGSTIALLEATLEKLQTETEVLKKTLESKERLLSHLKQENSTVQEQMEKLHRKYHEEQKVWHADAETLKEYRKDLKSRAQEMLEPMQKQLVDDRDQALQMFNHQQKLAVLLQAKVDELKSKNLDHVNMQKSLSESTRQLAVLVARNTELERKAAAEQAKANQTAQSLASCQAQAHFDSLEHAKIAAKMELYEQAYHEKQERMQRSATSLTGSDGENDILKLLHTLTEGHVDIQVTNTKYKSGDLQLRWKLKGSSRPALVTVEIKTSDLKKQQLQQRWVDQALQQMQTQRADAGLLLYNDAISSSERFRVESTGLVIVGQSHEPGNLLNGLVHAFMIGQEKVARESMEGKVMSPDEQASCRHMIKCFVDNTANSRQGLKKVATLAQEELKQQSHDILPLITKFRNLPQSVNDLFPADTETCLRVKNEQSFSVSIKRQKSGNAAPDATKKARLCKVTSCDI